MKGQPTEWKKIFANYVSVKGFILKMYKSSYYSTAKKKKKKNSFRKLAEDLNKHFSKEDIQMANTYMKRCSTSLIIRKMQIKTTKRYNLTPVGMTIIKKIRTNKY